MADPLDTASHASRSEGIGPKIVDARGGKAQQLTRAIALSGCMLLAFMLRAAPWRNFFDGSGAYLFYGPDSYDHLRRITLGLAEFPRVPTFDAFYGYPVGTGQIWSPLFDYLISLVTLLLSAGSPGESLVHAVGFWLSPCLAAATLFLLYRVGSLLFGKRAGLIAAAVLALLPGHILYSFVSELDHHVAEPMVCLLVMHAYLRGRDETEAARRSLPWSGALSLVFAILIWRGSIIFWGVLFLAVLVQSLADRWCGGEGRNLAGYGSRLAGLSALLTLPFCAFNVWGSSGGMSFGIVSWFHVAFLAAWALLFFLLQRRAGGRFQGKGVVAAVIALCIGALLLPAGRRFVSELLSGLVVVSRGDPWLDSISELRSMLFPQNSLDLWHGTETLSLLYWLFPALLWTLFRRWRQGGFRDLRWSLFLVWGGFFWLLPLLRERYVHQTAVVIALGFGYLVTIMDERLRERSRERLLPVAAVAALLLLLAPTAGFLRTLPDVGLPEKERRDLPLTLKWLRDHTPVPTGFMQPLRQPEYGVLADWGLGAYIDYVAQRPTVATNFGWETHGLFESAAFLTTPSPTVATGIVSANKVRYLLLSDVTQHLPNLRAIVEFGLRSGRSPLSKLEPFEPLASMYYRLYIQDGSAFSVQGVNVAALGTYRLVFESPEGSLDPLVGQVSHYKVFACVPGAIVAGTAPPGTAVELQLKLTSNTGRQFCYRDWGRADEKGRFAFRVPYPTNAKAGGVVAGGAYLVSVNGRNIRYSVSERDVESGNSGRVEAME